MPHQNKEKRAAVCLMTKTYSSIILFELRNEAIIVNIFVNIMYKNQTILTFIFRFYNNFSLSWYQCGSTKNKKITINL